jgi:hypothetical protein
MGTSHTIRFAPVRNDWHDLCDKTYRNNLTNLVKDYPSKVALIDGGDIVAVVADPAAVRAMRKYEAEGRHVSMS